LLVAGGVWCSALLEAVHMAAGGSAGHAVPYNSPDWSRSGLVTVQRVYRVGGCCTWQFVVCLIEAAW